MGQNECHGKTAIAVFGCQTRADGTPTPALARRLQRALDVATENPGAPIILSGRGRSGPVEAQSMGRWLQQNGIAEARLILEPNARNTKENAGLVADILQNKQVEHLILVTERYHMMRSEWLMRAELAKRDLGIRVDAAAAPDQLGAGGRTLRGAIEWIKLIPSLRWRPSGLNR